MRFPKSILAVPALALVACSGKLPAPAGLPSTSVTREPPKIEAKITRNGLKGGLASLKDRAVGALLVFNLPDGYMIRAKTKINPPDLVIKDLTALQADRAAWLNEALVVNCDKCGEIETKPPLQVLPEELLLRLIDRVSLKQSPTEADWADLAKAWPERDVLWLILVSEDYEQKRGPSREKGLVAAWAEGRVSLRSFVRDMKAKKNLHEASVEGVDEDFILYQRVNEPESGQPLRAQVALVRSENPRRWEPSASPLDSPRYDDVYPYPPIPESPVIIQKSLLRLTETLAP